MAKYICNLCEVGKLMWPWCYFTKGLRAPFSVQSTPVWELIYLLKALVKWHPDQGRRKHQIWIREFAGCLCLREKQMLSPSLGCDQWQHLSKLMNGVLINQSFYFKIWLLIECIVQYPYTYVDKLYKNADKIQENTVTQNRILSQDLKIDELITYLSFTRAIISWF